MNNSRKIGIMGGAFDPIHIGHLVTAEEAYCHFGLDEVIFMPSGIPAHKEAHSLVAAKQRLELTQLAISDNPHFSVSSYEVNKNSVSYTVDTMEAMAKEFVDAEIYFITGADAILEILTWKEPARIADYGYLIAATRPGYNLAGFEKLLNDNDELRVLKPQVFFISVPALAISSTDIRARISQNRPVRYLIPKPVEEYIARNHLYRR